MAGYGSGVRRDVHARFPASSHHEESERAVHSHPVRIEWSFYAHKKAIVAPWSALEKRRNLINSTPLPKPSPKGGGGCRNVLNASFEISIP